MCKWGKIGGMWEWSWEKVELLGGTTCFGGCDEVAGVVWRQML